MLLCVTPFALVIDAERRAGSVERDGGGGQLMTGLIIG
jgi:hypothetical protein